MFMTLTLPINCDFCDFMKMVKAKEKRGDKYFGDVPCGRCPNYKGEKVIT